MGGFRPWAGQRSEWRAEAADAEVADAHGGEPAAREVGAGMLERLATAEAAIEERVAGTRAQLQPPPAIARLGCEEELEAVLGAPIEGSAAAGYLRKEAAARAAFDRLTVAESRALAERLRRASPEDRLASLFGRMTVDRRGRLLSYLDDVRRREALRRARAAR
jgi:hypothetical protein